MKEGSMYPEIRDVLLRQAALEPDGPIGINDRGHPVNGLLYRARIEAGLTQGELAKRSGISYNVCSKTERLYTTPIPEHRVALAEAVGVSPDVLFPAWMGMITMGNDPDPRPIDEIPESDLVYPTTMIDSEGYEVAGESGNIYDDALARQEENTLNMAIPNTVDTLDIYSALDKVLPTESERNQAILAAYRQGDTLETMGKAAGISKQRVREIIEQQLKKIKTSLLSQSERETNEKRDLSLKKLWEQEYIRITQLSLKD